VAIARNAAGAAAGDNMPPIGSATPDGFVISAYWHVHYKVNAKSGGRGTSWLVEGPALNFTSEAEATIDLTEETNKERAATRLVVRSGTWHRTLSNIFWWSKEDQKVPAAADLKAKGAFGQEKASIGYAYDYPKPGMVSITISVDEPTDDHWAKLHGFKPSGRAFGHELDDATHDWRPGDIWPLPTIHCADIPFKTGPISKREQHHKVWDAHTRRDDDLEVSRQERKVELELSECAHDWIPAAQSDCSVGFVARCADPPGLPIKWRFELIDTSRLPGICNNANIDDFPSLSAAWQNSIKQNSRDLLFDFRYYGSKDKDFKTEDPWQVLESTKTLASASAKVSCVDWGAFGKLTAFGEIEGHWIRAKVKDKDGKIVGDAAVIPWAKDPNNKRHIAHEAKPHGSAETYDQLSHDGPATSDEDALPAGLTACKGDGLTLFEEYRGFFVRAGFEPNAAIVYERLYPDVKDFFVFMDADSALLFSRYLDDFQKASGLMVHRVGDDTLTEFINVNDRVVNFNRGNIGTAQHAVQVIDALLDDATGGLCFPHLGPPANVSMVFIDSSKFSEAVQRGGQYRDWGKRVTIHELGHSVGIPHHGNLDDFYLRPIVANEGGQRSGAFDCAMRYVGANFFVHNVSMDEPDPVNRPYDNQHEQIGLNFCESPTGTGLNDRGYKRWQCGDALAGACKTRIVVNDHCAAGGGGAPDFTAGGDASGPPLLDPAEKSAKHTQSEAKVAVRLEANGRQKRDLVPGEAIVFDLRLTGLPDAALTLGQPNEAWTKQLTFKVLGPNGTMVPWTAAVRAIGSPVEQSETPAQDRSPPPDKPAPNAIKITPRARYRAAFALDGNEAAKLGPGELRIFAALNNGRLLSNSVQLKIRSTEELSPQERAAVDSVRSLSQARVAYAEDKFESAEQLAREAIVKRADFFEAHLLLARTLRKQNKLREAYDEYGVALQTWKPRPGPAPEPPEEIWFALQSLGEQLHIDLQPPPPPRPFVAHSLFAESKGGKTNEPFPSRSDRIVFECEIAQPSNNPLGVRWIAAATHGAAPPNHLIATSISKPGELKPQFALKTPTAGFPPGEYRLEIWQNGKQIYAQRFNVNP